MLESLKFSRRQLGELDWLMLLCVLGLTWIGLFTIDGSLFPVEADRAEAAGAEIPLVASLAAKQFVFWILSLGALIAAVVIDYRVLKKIAWLLYIVGIAALVFLLIRQETIKGASSWFKLGPLRLQPSEFVKISTVAALALWLSKRPGETKGWAQLIVPMLIAGVPFVLIYEQPDIGTAAIFLPVTFAMVWAAGLRKRYVLAAAVAFMLAAIVIYPRLKEYQKQRIEVFLNPEADPQHAGYNIIQAQITIGSGQLFGKGWREGTQSRWEYLPENHTDFIFCSLVEQFGFVGAAVVLGLYLAILLRALAIAQTSAEWFGSYLTIGLVAIILTHILLNVGMVLRIFPVTGLPLPFLSYGGSFLLANYIVFGLILNVGIRKEYYDYT
ncbi:rod shape-determining protein RodA [Candidatus Sumerlaeota bacterium]|nr:rod shape-determining protein RodA [Candidatus Sumerlaeota bacterium]